jgi:hypothetical protein
VRITACLEIPALRARTGWLRPQAWRRARRAASGPGKGSCGRKGRGRYIAAKAFYVQTNGKGSCGRKGRGRLKVVEPPSRRERVYHSMPLRERGGLRSCREAPVPRAQPHKPLAG